MWKSLITRNLPILDKSSTVEDLNLKLIISEKKEAEGITIRPLEYAGMRFAYAVTILKKRGKEKGAQSDIRAARSRTGKRATGGQPVRAHPRRFVSAGNFFTPARFPLGIPGF
jgi:hypothetical protein